jgi:hypothetical protein
MIKLLQIFDQILSVLYPQVVFQVNSNSESKPVITPNLSSSKQPAKRAPSLGANSKLASDTDLLSQMASKLSKTEKTAELQRREIKEKVTSN